MRDSSIDRRPAAASQAGPPGAEQLVASPGEGLEPSCRTSPAARLSRAALALLALIVAACQGEVQSSTPTPPPPDDPHDQGDGEETIYWQSLGPASSSQPFYAVAGFDDHEVFLAGDTGAIWQWDGATLTQLDALITEEGEAPALNGLWTFSDSLGRMLFVVGDKGSIYRYQFNSAGFERLETNTRSEFKGIIGFARDDVWAVGDGGIYHFDGAAWARDTSTPGSSSLAGVWGTSSDDLYAVGDGGTLLHRAGGAWTPIALGRGEDLHAVWGTGSSSVYVVGQEGLVLHFDGASWSDQASGVFDHLWSVWGLGDTQVFAAGVNGVTLFYDGQGWQRLPTGSSRNLYGLWGPDIGHVYSAGAWSTFLLFDNDPAPPPLTSR